MKKYRASIDDAIAGEHRQFLQGVFPGPSDDEPPFIYTIGNHDLGLAELLLIGFDPYDMVWVLNVAAKVQRDRGRMFEHLETVDGIATMPLRFYDPDPKVRDLFTIQAGNYHGHQDYAVRQLLLPDKQGRFPDEEGVDPQFQTQLDLTRRRAVTH
jgi:hypothetical protein